MRSVDSTITYCEQRQKQGPANLNQASVAKEETLADKFFSVFGCSPKIKKINPIPRKMLNKEGADQNHTKYFYEISSKVLGFNFKKIFLNLFSQHIPHLSLGIWQF